MLRSLCDTNSLFFCEWLEGEEENEAGDEEQCHVCNGSSSGASAGVVHPISFRQINSETLLSCWLLITVLTKNEKKFKICFLFTFI